MRFRAPTMAQSPTLAPRLGRRRFLATSVAATSLYGAGVIGATPAAAEAGLGGGFAVETLEAIEVHQAPKALPQTPFQAETGETVTFADFKGDALLVNFWATWCAPCLKEMPSINTLAGAMSGRPFRVLTISVDRGGAGKPRAFLDKIGATHLGLFLDPKMTLAREIGAIGLPVTVLVDRQGRELARLSGHAEWDSPEAKRLAQAVVDFGGPVEA